MMSKENRRQTLAKPIQHRQATAQPTGPGDAVHERGDDHALGFEDPRKSQQYGKRRQREQVMRFKPPHLRLTIFIQNDIRCGVVAIHANQPSELKGNRPSSAHRRWHSVGIVLLRQTITKGVAARAVDCQNAPRHRSVIGR